MIKPLLWLALLCPMFLFAQEEPISDEKWQQAAEALLARLDTRTGTINLPAGHASLEVPENFHFLNANDASAVLVDLWGNPPGTEVLGMIVPADISLIDPNSWAVIIQYEEEGYVSDEDAADIDYDDLLDQMQADTEAANSERESMGYGRVDLVGWATPPHYDAASHKLYWAKELSFDASPDHTLNYNIRVLGRRGVLVLNAVANMYDLNDIELGMQQVLAFTNFDEGSRYQDFDPDIDEVAAYGLGALVAGKVAAKTGLLAKIGVLLLAAKKYLIIIMVVVGAWVSRLVSRRKAERPPST